MSRRPIGPVDTIWLNMDRPNNLMVIDILIVLEPPVDWERLLDVYRRRVLARYPVFSQRPVLPVTRVGTSHWEDDPDFDLEQNVFRAHLPRGDDEALQDYIAAQTSLPFDRRHPLWELHLIDGYDGGAVVYWRVHHALADGIAISRVVVSLTDATPGDDLLDTGEEEPTPPPMGILDGALQVLGAAGSAASAAASAATTAGARLLREAPRLLDPHRVGDAFTQIERTGDIANKLILAPHPHTVFSGTPGVEKRVVWCDPFPLEYVKQVGRLAGATINDVLMAAVAGALATYVREHGDMPEDVSTMVPVNVRPLDKPLPRELGNQFALVAFRLPLGIDSPFERIAETKRRMEVIKHSPEVLMTFELIKAIGRTGPELERFFVDFFADKAIGITTNVPGPREPRYLAGRRATRILGWNPMSGDQTLSSTIYSYDGRLHVGFRVDSGLVPDPEKLVDAFEAEVGELVRFARAV